MTIRLTDVNIVGFKTAISIPHDADLEYKGGYITGSDFGIVQRDPPSFLDQLGLPNDTPRDAVLIALMLLRDNQDTPLEKKAELLATSKLGPYLQNAANATAVVTSLVGLAGSPMGAQVIAWLKSL
ncbi:hypothetical protein D3C77_605360 [compost metagenome]